MKIGILTQPLGHNYGGILQAYALQQVLQEIGHDVEILDRSCNCITLVPLGRTALRVMSMLKSTIRRYLCGDKSVGINNPFRAQYTTLWSKPLMSFIHTDMVRSRPLYSTESLSIYIVSHKFEAVIVGSDQVWRQEYSPCITDYFLTFLSESSGIRRVAYAASFGIENIDIDPQLLPECICGLKKLDAVSVREERGRELLQDIFGIGSVVLLDPTMLLGRDTWLRLAHVIDDNAKIVSYILDGDGDKEMILGDVVKKMRFKRKDLIGYRQELVSIQDWLGALAGAGFVVTDSFHGCVFSILFNKPFIAIANRERGLSRFDTLLGHFGLKSRLVFSAGEYMARREELLKPMDYTTVNRTLVEMREKSRQFLKDALASS